jgi:predicted dehydrogenase
MTLTVGIAGCGYFGQFHQEAWSRIDAARVIAIADQDEAKLARAAERFPQAQRFKDAGEMFAKARPDVVDIVTAPETHLPLVTLAAKNGIAAICQKPLAPTWDECVAVVDTAERAGTRLIVHENFRFMPWFLESKALIDRGLVGEPMNISFRLRPGDGQGPDAYLSRQPYFQKMPRFLIHETAIHLIDVFRFLFGEVSGVFAKLKKLNPVIAGEDAGIVVFDFANGASGIFDGNRHIDHPADDTRMTNGVLLVEGTGGSIRLDGFGRLFVRPRGGQESEHHYTWEKKGYGGDCVFKQTQHAVDHLVSGTKAMNEGRDYLRNLAIEEAIYRSNSEGRFITL